MSDLLLPGAENVAQAWLVSRAGFDAAAVATTLPQRADWPSIRFLQVRAIVGAGTDVDIPQRRTSVLTLDGWAATAAGKALWGNALDQLERVRIATYVSGMTVLPMLRPGYQPARVLSVYLLSEPARVEGDPSGYARATCTLAIDWTV